MNNITVVYDTIYERYALYMPACFVNGNTQARMKTTTLKKITNLYCVWKIYFFWHDR